MSENDKEKEFEEYKTKAEQGDSLAMLVVGLCYYLGRGVDKDFKQAFKWYQKPAEAGNPEAMFYVGNSYKLGRGVNKDFKQAFKWYKKSAKAGDTTAMFEIGNCYQKGLGVERSFKQAFEWYKKSADAGYAIAMFKLAGCYYDGNGIKQDKAKAFEWYKKSAKGNNASAMFQVGNLFWAGDGIKQDKEKAFYWWQQAYKNNEMYLAPYAEIFNLAKEQEALKADSVVKLLLLYDEIHQFLKKQSEPKKVKTIAHYTNWQTLWKILGDDKQKGTLRLAPAQYMNDPSEGKFFFENVGEQAEKTIKYFTENNPDPSKKKSQDTTDIVSCIASFSKNANQLDLWRFYGRDGAGVAIEIECPKISEFSSLDITFSNEQTLTGQAKDRIAIFKISYGKEACQEAYKAIATNLETLKVFCKNDAKEHTDLVIAIKNISSALLSYLSYMFKDTHYENEKEYRLIKILPMNSSELKPDIQNGIPSFYSEIPIEKLKIKKVFIGPNQDAPQKIDLWMQNKQKGLT